MKLVFLLVNINKKMNSKIGRENLIYLLIWLIVLTLPIFTLRGTGDYSWTSVWMEWIRISPFILIFFMNSCVLVPRLLFRKKNLQYILYLSLIIVALSFLSDFTSYFRELLLPNDPPPFNGHGMPPRGIEQSSYGARIFDRILLSYLVVGFNTAVKLIFKRQEDEKANEEVQRMHLQTQLSFLRQQISPHFFMNTLNNIHALIEYDYRLAQVSVIKLSKLMRYLLTESQHGVATLKDEFEFLNAYIDLMRLRFSERVQIKIEWNFDNPERKIHSLLFVSLVENAFKYGVDHVGESTITILAETVDDKLILYVENNKFPKIQHEFSSGLGLENLKKQLKLLYSDNFELSIWTTEDHFYVQLTIPLEDD